MTMTSHPETITVICDECGDRHPGTLSHPARHGSGMVYEVICPADGQGLSDYYLSERAV
jgi:hypothetical protein